MSIQDIMASIDPTNMETFARAVLMLTTESQDQFFAVLPEFGFTAEEVKELQKCVTLYKLHTNRRYYMAMREAVCESLAKEWCVK